MEKVELKVEGMTCTNCALSINKYLQTQGLQNIKVNFIGGDVSFEMIDASSKEKIAKGITNLGYKVVNETLLTQEIAGKKNLFYFLFEQKKSKS